MEFCLVEYRPLLPHQPPDAKAPIILLALQDSDSLQIFIEPRWETYVEGGDKEYISELISDLRARAILQPNELFRQLGALSLHPLRTRARGDASTAGDEITNLKAQFVEL